MDLIAEYKETCLEPLATYLNHTNLRSLSGGNRRSLPKLGIPRSPPVARMGTGGISLENRGSGCHAGAAIEVNLRRSWVLERVLCSKVSRESLPHPCPVRLTTRPNSLPPIPAGIFPKWKTQKQSPGYRVDENVMEMLYKACLCDAHTTHPGAVGKRKNRLWVFRVGVDVLEKAIYHVLTSA